MAAAAVLAAVDNHLQVAPALGVRLPDRGRPASPRSVAVPDRLQLLDGYLRLNWRAGALALSSRSRSALVWFVIDWFGARQFFRSAGAATQAEPRRSAAEPASRGSRRSAKPGTWCPGRSSCCSCWDSRPQWSCWWRAGRRAAPSPSVWLGLGAFGWLAVDAVLAQGRFATGAPRYLLPGVALACVVAGVFVADVVRAIARVRPGSRVRLLPAAVVCRAVVGFLAPRASPPAARSTPASSLAAWPSSSRPTCRTPSREAGGRDAVDRLRAGQHAVVPGADGRLAAAYPGRRRDQRARRAAGIVFTIGGTAGDPGLPGDSLPQRRHCRVRRSAVDRAHDLPQR